MSAGETGLVLEQGVLAYLVATLTTPRSTRMMNITMITSHMFWPPIIKLTSLLVGFCSRTLAAGRESVPGMLIESRQRRS
jgi:hypothetical protein